MDKLFVLLRWLVALPLWAILSALVSGAAIAINSYAKHAVGDDWISRIRRLDADEKMLATRTKQIDEAEQQAKNKQARLGRTQKEVDAAKQKLSVAIADYEWSRQQMLDTRDAWDDQRIAISDAECKPAYDVMLAQLAGVGTSSLIAKVIKPFKGYVAIRDRGKSVLMPPKHIDKLRDELTDACRGTETQDYVLHAYGRRVESGDPPVLVAWELLNLYAPSA